MSNSMLFLYFKSLENMLFWVVKATELADTIFGLARIICITLANARAGQIYKY